jgi:hypothetical protein
MRQIEPDNEHYQKQLQTEKNPPRHKYTKEERDNEADAKLLKKANERVTKPITRLVNQGGRPRKYTPVRLRNVFNSYFCDCEKKDKIPSLKGMMLYAKMSQQSAYQYAKYPEFQAIFEQARTIISEWLESDIYNTKGNSSGKVAYMQNVWGWSNKTEVETTTREMSIEEARAKIEMLAPALLELLKSSPELIAGLLPAPKVIEAEVVNE